MSYFEYWCLWFAAWFSFLNFVLIWYWFLAAAKRLDKIAAKLGIKKEDEG